MPVATRPHETIFADKTFNPFIWRYKLLNSIEKMYFISPDSIRSDKDMIMCARAIRVCVCHVSEKTLQFDGKCIFNDFANTRNEFRTWAAST